MVKLFDSFLEAVKRYDLEGSFTILDDILSAGKTKDFSKMLEKLTENKEILLPYQLRIRDHIYEYLDCNPLYFALYIPSYALLDKLSDITDRDKARGYVASLVREMVESKDSRLDLSIVEVDQLMSGRSRYIVILPSVLEIRNNELEQCRIQYSTVASGQIIRYCISELLQTYFGRKMIAALNLELKNATIGGDEFGKLETTLKSLDFNVEAMLVKIPEAGWSQFVSRKTAISEWYENSNELRLLHDASLARIELGTDTWEAKWNALKIIAGTKTKFCNDAVGLAASDKDSMVAMPAIQFIESTKDVSQIPLLSDVLNEVISDPNVAGGIKAAVSKAISVLSSTQFSSSLKKDHPPQIESDPKMFDYIRNHMIPRVAELIEASKETPGFSVEKEELVTGLLLKGMGPQFEKLMNDPDPHFRRTLLDVAEFLPKDDARGVVAKGLQDKDPSNAARATEILESRWADEFW
ncbi:MAG: hypothetical protein RTU63_03205 [Candidatus Thorarchaeota archaeon]